MTMDTGRAHLFEKKKLHDFLGYIFNPTGKTHATMPTRHGVERCRTGAKTFFWEPNASEWWTQSTACSFSGAIVVAGF